MILTNTLFRNETADIALPYRRSAMSPGDHIDFKPLRSIKNFLKESDEIVFSMYWKPLGDSFLFLSVLKAINDFFDINNKKQKPKYILDKKFAPLVRKISFMEGAVIKEDAIAYFKETYGKGHKIFLITDDEPFWLSTNTPIFNSEEFKYPRFYEEIGGQKIFYPSRPARYFLTLERECQTVLYGNPNESLPFFIQKRDSILESEIKINCNIVFNNSKYIALVAQTSKVEKKFGLLKYLSLAEKIIKESPNNKIIFLSNKHEESPAEWIRFEKEIKKLKDKIILYSTEKDNFNELSYIFARCAFIVGDDTGFSHLAAMSRINNKTQPPKTFIIYAKHDYSKWSTGHKNVIPIATKLAKFLAKTNMSVRRDKIIQEDWGDQAYAYSISVDKVLKIINKNL